MLCWQINSYSSKMELQPTYHSRHKDWIALNSPDFISKNEWPPNSPDLNPLDYHVWGAMLHNYQQLSPKPSQTIWDELWQDNKQGGPGVQKEIAGICCGRWKALWKSTVLAVAHHETALFRAKWPFSGSISINNKSSFRFTVTLFSVVHFKIGGFCS